MPTFVRLTRAALRALPVGSRLSEHGIIYEKLPGGDGKFSIQLRIDGQKVHRAIGRESEGATRGDAESVIERLKTESRESRLKLPKGRKLELNFKEAASKYLERLQETNGKDLVSKKAHLNLHLIPHFGTKPLSQIVSFDLDRYKHSRYKQKAKPATINRELAALSHLFNKSVEWGWIEKAPCAIRKVPDDARKDVYLEPHECENLLEAARTIDHQLYLFIKVGISCGMRMSEILSIQIEHINLAGRTIYIPRAKAGARPQHISGSLASYLAFYLKQYCSHDQKWLFPSEKSPSGHRENLTKIFRKAVKKAEITKPVNRHTLRHTAVSLLVQAGVDLPTVMRISGHKTLRMVERYAHQNNSHIQNALDNIDVALKRAKSKEVKEA